MIKVELCHCCWTFRERTSVRVPFLEEGGEADSDVNRSEEVHIPFFGTEARGKKNFPCGPLAVWPADKQKCLQSQGTNAERVHIRGSLIVAVAFCCFAPRTRSMSWQRTFHLVSSSLTPPIFLFSLILRAFVSACLSLSLSCPLRLALTFSPPHPPPPLPSISLPPPACFGVCAGVSRRGWRLIVARWFRRTPDTGALSHNVGMCNLVRIRVVGGGCCPC